MVIKKSYFFVLILLLTFVLLTNFILAEGNYTKDHSKELQAAYNNAKCRIDFSMGVISAMVSASSSASSLSNYSDKLASDMTELQTFVNNNDWDGFKSFVKSTFDPDFKVARETVNSWRKTSSWRNLTAEQRKSLRDSYSSQKSTYDTCHLNSLKEVGQGRVTAFNAILDSHQKRADTLKSKGLDTSSLDKIIQDAKTQIVDPLQAALNNTRDAKAVHSALKGYCLFDGCKEGINFHLEAKFEIAKLEIALNKLKTSNVSADKLTQLETYINNAKNALNSVGTGRYNDQTKRQVWNNIKSAYSKIKEIKQTLKGE